MQVARTACLAPPIPLRLNEARPFIVDPVANPNFSSERCIYRWAATVRYFCPLLLSKLLAWPPRCTWMEIYWLSDRSNARAFVRNSSASRSR